ncbi:uncharacterized protein C9orf85 homolog [Leguminivora glycinivorella]|uniref:uncharacterized protein C9orf85 homolog n=1 Tax=Leguminivora glycinivorella TaxID=1035111 RepID=UPI00200D3720|nr:uncharacterized protein C9orf85 homolog [Leguminivora glycinivorella]
MSTSRGNATRTRPQKHQNKSAYKNDLHDKTNKTKFLNNLDVTGVCKRCKDIIDWKIKYKKYKPLTAPRKCVGCEEKAIKYAYHILCTKCATKRNVCAKCNTAVEANEPETEKSPNVDLQAMLKGLPERKRRTIMRAINKTCGDGNMTPEILSQVEEMLKDMDNLDLGDDEDFDDFGSDDSDQSED